MSQISTTPSIGTSEQKKPRVLAERMSNERTKKMMLKVADDYDQLPSEQLYAPSARRRGADAPTRPFAGAGGFTGAFSVSPPPT